jgi:hypothetical protein
VWWKFDAFLYLSIVCAHWNMTVLIFCPFSHVSWFYTVSFLFCCVWNWGGEGRWATSGINTASSDRHMRWRLVTLWVLWLRIPFLWDVALQHWVMV